MGTKTPEKPAVAMPRALWHHLHPGLWNAFFTHLGFDVVLSDETSRRTVECAALISESEHCLPVKLHDAHLQEAAENAPIVFIPRILSTRRRHIACPKLGALPDCAMAQFGDRVEIITVDIDEARFPLRRSLLRLGRSLKRPRSRIRAAADTALSAMQTARTREKEACSPPDGTDYFLILGHPYNIRDRYMAGPILSKLDALGAQWRPVDHSEDDFMPEPLKWDACSLMHDALLRLDSERCRGVIQLSSFNCGCDSVAMEIFRDLLRRKDIPYVTLVLDENEAQAGVDTRLEAFVDSIGWRHVQTGI